MARGRISLMGLQKGADRALPVKFYVIAGVIVLALGAGSYWAWREGGERRTANDLRAVFRAVRGFAGENGACPAGGTIDLLAPSLQPTHLKKVPRKDGWRNALRYETWAGPRGGEFAVGSPGRDGKWERPSLQEYHSWPDYRMGDDIVLRGVCEGKRATP